MSNPTPSATDRMVKSGPVAAPMESASAMSVIPILVFKGSSFIH